MREPSWKRVPEMPVWEIPLPVGARNIRALLPDGSVARLEPSFYRRARGGDVPVLALLAGDKFVGDTLEGHWETIKYRNPPCYKRVSGGQLLFHMEAAQDGSLLWGDMIFSRGYLLKGSRLTAEISTQTANTTGYVNCFRFILGTTRDRRPYNGLIVEFQAKPQGTRFLLERVVDDAWDILWTGSLSTSGQSAEWEIEFNSTIRAYKDGELIWSGDKWFEENWLLAGFCSYAYDTTPFDVYIRDLEVEQPEDIKVLYDLELGEAGKGDVAVYDTLGEEDEAEWQKVLSPAHVFKGDCVVENGLVRVRLDLDASEDKHRIFFYRWNGSGWSEAYWLAVPANEGISSFALEKVSPDEAVLTTDKAFYDVPGDACRITVRRGLPYVLVERLTGVKETRLCIWREARRFDFTLGAGLRDSVLNTGWEGLPPGGEDFCISIDAGGGPLHVKGRSMNRNFMKYSQTYGGHLAQVGRGELLVLGFSQGPSKCFFEAEDAIISAGAEVDTSLDDDSGESIRLDAEGDYVSLSLEGGSDLPVGRYKLALRAKQSGDPTSITGDLALSVRNLSDGKDMLLPPGVKTLTPGNEFGYYYADLEITGLDEGDQIEVKVEKATSAENIIWVDYLVLIPVANGVDWPQDITHNAMRKVSLRAVLLER